MKKSALLFYLIGLTTQAAVVGNYSVSISDKDGENYGRGTDGWNCKASLDSAYKLRYRDHSGQIVASNKSSSVNLGYSLLDRQKAEMTFEREISDDLGATDNRFILTETCTKQETTTRTYMKNVYDADGNIIGQQLATEPVTLTKTQSLHYICEVKSLPIEVSKAQAIACQPTKMNTSDSEWRWNSWGSMWSPGFNWGSIGDSPITKLMGTKFQGSVKLNSTEEKFTRDLCNGEKKNRTIIRLKQGARQGFAEGDVTFHVDIDNGKYKFDVVSKDGLLSDDIAYCDGGDRIDVKVTATGKGFLYSAPYTGKDGSDQLTFDRSARSRTKEIELLRKGKEKAKNKIAVTLIDDSRSFETAEAVPHNGVDPRPISAEVHR